MAADDNVIRLKNIKSLAQIIADEIADITLQGGDSAVIPHDADFALYVPDSTSIIVTGKQQPALSLGGWSIADTVYTAAISYDGDGTLSTDVGTITNGTLTVNDADGSFAGVISASSGNHFAASKLYFDFDATTIAGESVTVTVAADPKPVPSLSIGGWSVADTVYSAVVSYSGDGALSVNNGTITNGTLTVSDADGTFNGVISAAEGTNFAPAKLYFDFDTTVQTVGGGGGKPIPVLAVGNWNGFDATITYTGDGALGVIGGSLSSTLLTAGELSGIIYARETDNYAAAITDWSVQLSEFVDSFLTFEIDSPTYDLAGNSWTVVGSASLDSAIKKFGSASLHCPSGSYLLGNCPVDVHSSLWTVDFWLYPVSPSNSGISGFFQFGVNSSTSQNKSGVLCAKSWVGVAGFNDRWQFDVNPGWLDNTGQWYHIAVVKNNNVITFFIDGHSVASYTLAGEIMAKGNYIWLGQSSYNDRSNDTYIDNFRVTRDIALWTEDFTPPAMPS